MTSKQAREIIDNILKDQALMEFPLRIKRQYAASLDTNEVWYDLEELKAFAQTGATKYIGESVVLVDEATKTITAYRIGFGGQLIQEGSAVHVHEPEDIKETDEKQFVSKADKTRWDDKYTKQETDEKLKAAISGLEFKGTFTTLADLPSAEEAKDGWFAIVVNEPTAEGKNVLVIFESTTKEWKQLGDLLVPGVATESLDGLMGKDMVKALNKAGVDIAGLKDGSLLPKASTTQLGAVKQGANITIAEDGTISTHTPYVHPENHAATMIVEDETHRFVTDADKASYADKYTKTETDTKISEAITASEEKVTVAYQTADKLIDDKVTAMDAAYKAADTQINESMANIDKAYKAEDTAIRVEFAAADTALEGKVTEAYKAADAIIDGKVAALTETHNTDKTALEEKIAGVDAKFVAATEEQIDALFATV